MADATVARVRLALEGASAVEQGLTRVQAKVSDMGKTLVGLAGGLSVAGFAAWVKGAVDAADEMNKVAQKTGLAVKEVSGLQLAWRQAGGSAEQFVPIMAKLGVAVSNGNKALDAMGVSSKNADGSLKSTRQVLAEVSDKFASYETGARKTALAVGLLGEEGAKALPFLNQGAKALSDYDEMAQRLGLTLDQETTQKAEKFNDTLDLIGQSTQGFARQVAAQLLPTLTTLTQEFFNNATKGDNLKKTADFLAGGLKSLYSVGVGVVEVFKTMGVAMGGVGAAIGAVLSGEFSQAKDIINQMRADISVSWAEAGASIKRVWAGAGSETVAALAATSAEAKRNAPVMNGAAKASKAKADADKEAAKAAKDLADTMAKVSALSDKLSEQYVKDADAVADGNAELRAEIELIGLSAGERARLLEVKEQEIIAGKQLELISLQNADADAVTIANLEREIALRQQRVGLLGQRTVAEAAAAQKEAETKAAEEAAKKQQDAYIEMWKSIDDTAHDVFVSVANEGEDAFKRIGKTLKAAVLDLLYQMTVKKWIIQISGQGSVGGFGGGGGNNLLMSAAQSYMSGGSALGSSASAVGSWATGSMSTANTTGTGMNGLLATNGAYGTAASGGASGAASAGSSAGSMMSYAGYAALIYAAVKYAESLYAKGYNRDMLGKGQSQSYTFGRGNRTSGQTDNAGYNYSVENFKRQGLDSLGMSQKWADILSGTTRYAHMFARKLSSYGYSIGLEGGGGVSVGGYETYKAGWAGRLMGRGSKTRSIDIDQRDVQAVSTAVTSVREGAKGMAAAMGLSAEAIDNYTGRLKVNMKGANTAAEQSERMRKAMDDLQYSLLKAASGGKMARSEFDRLMEQVRSKMEEVGISSAGIADIIAQGMLGKMSQAQVGEALSEMVIGGIYNAVVSPFAASIADAFMAQIIVPMMTAVTTGGSVSNAVSQASIQSVVATANAAAKQLTVILNDPEFRAAINGIQQAISGISVASVRPAASVKRFGSAVKSAGSAASAAADEIKRAWTSIMDSLVDEVRRLRGEILGSKDQALSYTVGQFAAATAAARAGDTKAADQLTTISRSVEEAALRESGSRADLNAIRGWLIESQMQTASIIGSRYRLAVPAFDVGTNYVPRDMLAMIHEGEAVVPKEYNPAAGGNDAMLAEMRAMRAEAKRAADASAAASLKLDEIAKGRWALRTVAA